jgi:kojibiose phosphorylase
MTGRGPSAEIPPSFCLSEGALDPATTKHFEGAFTQGSGYLHVRGCHEEGLAAAPQDEVYMRLPADVTLEKPRHPRSKRGTYVPGITGHHPLLREELVNLPWIMELAVFSDGERLDMDACRIEEYERCLDMRDGVLSRRFTWKTARGAVLQASYRRYVSRKRQKVCVQEVEYECRAGECTLRIEAGIDAGVRTNGFDHFTDVACSAEGSRAKVLVTTDTGDKVALCTEARVSGCAFVPVPGHGRRPVSAAQAQLRAGEVLRLLKLGAVATSRDLPAVPSVEAAAEGELDAAFAARSALYAEHAADWTSMWKKSAVLIEGDEAAQKAVNFAVYHLLRAANPLDGRVAVCAKGSAGEAYFGHFFWDTEIYLLPFYLCTWPEAARALMEFRLNTLPGAERNAALYGYRGARYPWESSVSGDEQCPNWQYADFEVHVTADVVHGLRHYVAATGDHEMLARAADLLVETARYWVSRVERRPGGAVNLNGVMGPDEYLFFSNNNAYTNGMVKRALHFTLETLRALKARQPETYAALVSRRSVTAAELGEIAAVADALPIRGRADGVIMQCDGFESFEDVDFNVAWKDRSKPFGHFVSQERNYRSKALKQADVLMLAHLFPAEFTVESLSANYDYYEPLTTHDSSLSSVIHSILAARLGRADAAWGFFRRALDIDLDSGSGGAAEGIHIANCGGIWQAVVMGFAGMSWAYETDAPRFEPRLPRQWASLQFPLSWKGREYAVRIDHAGAVVKEVKS